MDSRRTAWVWWAGGFAAWTALALLNASERAIWLLHRGEPVAWGMILAHSIASWYSCLVFLPLFVVVTRRWPLDRRHLATRLPLHTALIVASSVGAMTILHVVSPLLPGARVGSTLPLVSRLAGNLISEIIAFGCVTAALHALEFYRRYRERERLALQLQARLSDAQLRALRAQLNPHFLFNTLNAATALVHRDPDAADAMLTRLGELLRLTLRSDPAHETPLHEEMALLERYLAIMRIRFADRVTVRSEVESRVADALVPSFILQPIVENAFEHGVARVQRPARIDIAARASGDALVLTVRDDGPGPEGNGGGPAPANGNGHGFGVGLANTRRRLAELYGEAGMVTMTAPPRGGTEVEVRLPLRLGAPA
jgi:two-component system LytT family sensor kinase